MKIEVPIEEFRKQKLFIATPMYGGQCFGSYTKSLLDLSRACMQHGIDARFSFLFNESLITRARNYLVDEFLRTDCTKLIFIDSDIDFNPMDVLALAALDKPIIGGPYPKKCIAWENVYDAVKYGFVPSDQRHELSRFAGDFVFNVAPGTKQIKLDTPTEVLEIGTGFMAVKREVFTAFSEAYPDYWYNPDHNRSDQFAGDRKIYQYFQAEIVPTPDTENHSRYLSEDYWFCQKARNIGQSVWLCPWMEIKHHGTHIYSGSITSMAQVINERNARGEVTNLVTMDRVGEVIGRPPSTGPTPQATTVREFKSQWSRSAREAQLSTWATQVGKEPQALIAAYNASIKDKTANLDSSVADHVSTLVAAL